jgi:hypothetical protein
VPGQQVLDLAGAELLATPVDDVLAAPGDGDVAGIVDRAQVAGVEPTSVVDDLGAQRGVDVAEHALGPAHPQLALGARR